DVPHQRLARCGVAEPEKVRCCRPTPGGWLPRHERAPGQDPAGAAKDLFAPSLGAVGSALRRLGQAGRGSQMAQRTRVPNESSREEKRLNISLRQTAPRGA